MKCILLSAAVLALSSLAGCASPRTLAFENARTLQPITEEVLLLPVWSVETVTSEETVKHQQRLMPPRSETDFAHFEDVPSKEWKVVDKDEDDDFTSPIPYRPGDPFPAQLKPANTWLASCLDDTLSSCLSSMCLSPLSQRATIHRGLRDVMVLARGYELLTISRRDLLKGETWRLQPCQKSDTSTSPPGLDAVLREMRPEDSERVRRFLDAAP